MGEIEALTMYSLGGDVPSLKLKTITLEDKLLFKIEDPIWNINSIQYGRNGKGTIEKFILTIDKNQTEDRKEKENENC